MTDGRNPDGTYDGAVVLSKVAGLSSTDIRSIWSDVQANAKALKNCAATHHTVDEIESRPGHRKWKCRVCGGTMGLEIVQYIRGYEAAGGKGVDIWPEWTA